MKFLHKKMVIFKLFWRQNLIQIYTKTHQIAAYLKNLSPPPNPPKKGGASQYIPQAGYIFLPNTIPPMFEHGFTPLLKMHFELFHLFDIFPLYIAL